MIYTLYGEQEWNYSYDIEQENIKLNETVNRVTYDTVVENVKTCEKTTCILFFGSVY